MKTNKVKQILRDGKIVFVPEINRIFSPKIVDIIGLLGYECIWIDMEHSDASLEQIGNMTTSARAGDLDVIVRVTRDGYSSIIKLFELGVNGLVLPHCMSADDAKKFVRMSKFFPAGLRGIGGGGDSEYGMVNIKDYVKDANNETLLLVMIEDKEAVDNAGSIASVKGIDVLFIGPGDLSHSYGITGELEHPLIIKAMEKVSRACKKYKKSWGSVAGPGGKIDRLLNLGAQFINITSETNVLIEGYKLARGNVVRKFTGERGK